MERIAFLVEGTGTQVRCLLNPESLVVRRRAGLRQRQSAGGLVTGASLTDDPLFFTGGGATEFTLDLLFDVHIPGSSIDTLDVRELTRPLWQLAENASAGPSSRGLPVVSIIWGKSVYERGVVDAVAERLEYFTREGVPQRSWLRMRMLRLSDSEVDPAAGALPVPELPEDPAARRPRMPEGPIFAHRVTSPQPDGVAPESGAGERLDQLAYRYYGDPAHWRVLAWLNDIDDPLRLAAGAVLKVASRSDVESDRS